MLDDATDRPDYGSARCVECRVRFARRKPWQRFCRVACRAAWHAREIAAARRLLRRGARA